MAHGIVLGGASKSQCIVALSGLRPTDPVDFWSVNLSRVLQYRNYTNTTCIKIVMYSKFKKFLIETR